MRIRRPAAVGIAEAIGDSRLLTSAADLFSLTNAPLRRSISPPVPIWLDVQKGRVSVRSSSSAEPRWTPYSPLQVSCVVTLPAERANDGDLLRRETREDLHGDEVASAVSDCVVASPEDGIGDREAGSRREARGMEAQSAKARSASARGAKGEGQA
jgi:hypothetical protein